jgi:hypothetical protein
MKSPAHRAVAIAGERKWPFHLVANSPAQASSLEFHVDTQKSKQVREGSVAGMSDGSVNRGSDLEHAIG